MPRVSGVCVASSLPSVEASSMIRCSTSTWLCSATLAMILNHRRLPVVYGCNDGSARMEQPCLKLRRTLRLREALKGDCVARIDTKPVALEGGLPSRRLQSGRLAKGCFIAFQKMNFTDLSASLFILLYFSTFSRCCTSFFQLKYIFSIPSTSLNSLSISKTDPTTFAGAPFAIL